MDQVAVGKHPRRHLEAQWRCDASPEASARGTAHEAVFEVS
jgi:hypothetical protein